MLLVQRDGRWAALALAHFPTLDLLTTAHTFLLLADVVEAMQHLEREGRTPVGDISHFPGGIVWLVSQSCLVKADSARSQHVRGRDRTYRSKEERLANL